jgi:hypothetical protein
LIDIKDGQTPSIREDVLCAYDIDDMREILNKYSDSYTSWKRFINELLAYYGFNVSRFAADCGFSRNTVKKWRDKGDMPKGRKEFIKLGFGVGMTLEDINNMLQRYGKYPKLYAKSLEDAIYIFAHMRDMPFSGAEELSKNLLAYFELSTREMEDIDDLESTSNFHEQIRELNKEEELLAFIDENKAVFMNVYSRLTAYIDAYIAQKTINHADTKECFTLHSLLSGKISNPHVVGYLDDLVSALRTRKVIPNRLRLVALGIHLEMTMEEIDEMLELANMERLCPKDKVECAVMFAIENLLLNDHDDLVGGLLERMESDPRTKEHCTQIIDKYRRIDEANDYSGSDIAEYLVETLRELELEEARAMMELLR